MAKILVTGSNGQLGSELRHISPLYSHFDFIFTDVNELDISNIDNIDKFFIDKDIKYVINCAAYTAVDKAEEEQGLAKLINTDAVKNLAIVSEKYNAKLIHVSTDFVFDGTHHKPYTEDIETNPISVYGKTKDDAEKEALKAAPETIILRTSWLYSSYGNNFVKTIMKLANERDNLNIIFDQIGTPTYAYDLAITILTIINKINNDDDKYTPGIYHYSNEGVASWYDFAKAISEYANINCDIQPLLAKDYPLPAKRPHFSVLDKSKVKSTFNIKIPYWRDSLKSCIKLILEVK